MKKIIDWFKSLFFKEYKLIVSYNMTYGDSDDQVYYVRKFKKKTANHLIFETSDGLVVEVNSATGLHYRIEER